MEERERVKQFNAMIRGAFERLKAFR